MTLGKQARTLSDEKRIEDDPAKRTPNKWQNWYHSKRDAVFASGEVNRAGWWPSPNIWPSREVAEAKAREHNIQFRDWMREYRIQWGGSFPEGERP